MIDYHLAKRDYLEESKKKLKKQIELSEGIQINNDLLVFAFYVVLHFYVVAVCINTKIS